MSRNLSAQLCPFCSGTVVLDEPARPIKEHECAPYYDEYRGMQVAGARCQDCLALYLAWITPAPGHSKTTYYNEGTHYDLSFRSTFDDEPGLSDLPKFLIERKAVRVGLFDPRVNYSYLLRDDHAETKD